jgi:hypothetical protein
VSDGWHEFYFMIGSTAGALIGLVFVVITLTASFDPRRMELAAKVYITPVVVHFVSVMFAGAVALVPELPTSFLGALLLIPSAAGLSYIGVVIRRFFGPLPNQPHWTDPIFYAALPSLAYLAMGAAAILFFAGNEIAPAFLASGTLSLLFIGVRDAWDVAFWVSTHPEPKDH